MMLIYSISLNCKTMNKRNQTLEKIQIDSVEINHKESTNKKVLLTIRGLLPNPAYTFDHFEIKKCKNAVTIIPWALYDREKIVIQMAVRFEEKCVVKGLSKGHYRFKVVGRSGTIVQSMDF